MTSSTPPILTVLAAWPAGPGSSRPARRAARSWAGDVVLASFATPGATAVAVFGPDGTAVLEALTARPGDDWAATAALAGLVPWMVPIASRWARSGMGAPDVEAAVADLVGESVRLLTATPPCRQRPAVVVQSAWHRVHNTRRTDRARTARHLHLDHPALTLDQAVTRLGPTTVELLLVELAAAARQGTVSVESARALAWQAAGWPTAEVTKWTGIPAATLRARRARAVRVLAAGRVG